MTFPRIAKINLFEHLLDRRQKGQRCPSLAWIVKQSRLVDEAQAESLLRDMERDGVLTVYRMGPYPWVALKRLTYTGTIVAEMTLDPERYDQFTDGNDVLVVKAAPDPRTLPSKARANDEDDIEDAVAEIERQARAITNEYPEARGTARKAPTVEESTSAQRDTVSASLQPEPEPEVSAAPPVPISCTNPLLAEIDAFLAKHPMADTTFGKKAVNDAGYVARLRRGTLSGVRVTSKVRAFMAGYLPDALVSQLSRRGRKAVREGKTLSIVPAVAPIVYREAPAKPRVRAEIVRAWQNDGRPFDEFLTALLDLGLESYLAFREAA